MPSILEMIWVGVCVCVFSGKKADDGDLGRKMAQIPEDFRPCLQDGGIRTHETSKQI